MKQKARSRIRPDKTEDSSLLGRGWNCTKVLFNLCEVIASATDGESLLENLVRILSQAFESERVSLFLSNEAERLFVLKASAGRNSPPALDCSIPADHPLIQALLDNPHPVVREDIEANSKPQDTDATTGKMGRLRSEVWLPLRVKGKVTGLLNFILRPDQAVFSDGELEFLSAVADQAAIGIENGRLHQSLKESQDMIRRADRLSSLGQLTAGFAHEIRNTLVAIRTFNQLFPERYMDPEFQNGFQNVALKEVDRICSLVNDLLSFARPSAPNVSAESVNSVVEAIVQILEAQAKEKGIQFNPRLSAGLPLILMDKEQIKQVSMNIILNALQSIDGGGVVEVSTRRFGENAADPFVQIAVRDTGVGIPAKDLENIFDPFFTSKEGGSGLGLSISRQIVKDHGGSITVESQVGLGTTFYINLPVRGPIGESIKDACIQESEFCIQEKDPGC